MRFSAWQGTDKHADKRVQSRNDLVLRPFNYCVIDEVDSILIDEARTPLIISGTRDGRLIIPLFKDRKHGTMRSSVYEVQAV